MRITNKMVQKRLLKSLQKATERLTKSQDRISSHKNIKRPSDDPIGFMRIMSYQRQLGKVRQTIRNANSASLTFSQMDIILEQVGDVLLDARIKALSMATDTVTADSRRAVANEIRLTIDDVIQKANTKLGGRYIFSGHKIYTQPYQEINGQIEYVGDQGVMEQRIELGNSMEINIPGDEVFGTPANGVFKVLTDLKNALEANNVDGIQDSLQFIDQEIDCIASVRGEVGVKINRVDASVYELNIMELELTDELSQVQDVNIVMEAGEYMTMQESYQAALEATASTLRLPSLLDYLR